jgi:protease I
MNRLRKVPRIDGAKIAVVVESKFIPEEIWGYFNGFPLLGAELELSSRIWYGEPKPEVATFYSDSAAAFTRTQSPRKHLARLEHLSFTND